jgi:hypothetical protein
MSATVVGTTQTTRRDTRFYRHDLDCIRPGDYGLAYPRAIARGLNG